MANIIMSECAATAFLERQPRLSAVQSLDLALFIDTEDQALVGWVQIKSNHIGQLFQEFDVPRELKAARSMGLDVILLPQAVDGAGADVLGSRHRSATPVSRTFWLGLQGGGHYGRHLLLVVQGLAPPTG